MAQSYKKHVSVLNDSLKAKIEPILHRLKNSVSVYEVNSWLENFESNEVDLALDFLLFLEYITFPELQYRLEEQLKKILRQIPKEHPIIFLPFGDYPKSGELVMYLLAKLAPFKAKNSKLRISRDIYHEIIEEKTFIVYVDDFIGSGKSFRTLAARENQLCNVC